MSCVSQASLRASEGSVPRIVRRFEEIFFRVKPWGDGSARPPEHIDQRAPWPAAFYCLERPGAEYF